MCNLFPNAKSKVTQNTQLIDCAMALAVLPANQGAVHPGKVFSLCFIKGITNGSGVIANLVFQGWVVSEECSIIGFIEIKLR